VIRSVTNEVLVPVVVRDARGHAVGNLTKGDFEVFDNGRAQTITGFTVINRAAENAEARSSASSPDATGSAAVSPPLPPAQRFIVMLFDVYNLSVTDLAQAREAAITVIDSSLTPTDMAAVVSTSGANSGLTTSERQMPGHRLLPG
jgi:VWFA-related protein